MHHPQQLTAGAQTHRLFARSVQQRTSLVCRAAAPSQRRSTTTDADSQRGAFNFAPASALDDAVYGCSMPGFAQPLPDAVALTPVVVEPWATFLKGQGISTVIVLLGEDEITMFDPPLLGVYTAQGFTAHHLRARAPGSFAQITAVMEAALQQGTRVVVHCTGGCHRVGTVLTAWIKHRHGLTADEAAALMAATAAEHGVNREAPSSIVLQQYMDGTGW